MLLKFKEKDANMYSSNITEDTAMINNDIIQWNQSNIFVQSGGYARMTTLPDGDLACVYTSGGYVRYCTSADEGITWSAPTNVIKIESTPTGQKMVLANANIVVMKNGAYMVAFRAHTGGPVGEFTSFYSSIRYCISRDKGVTWSEDIIVVENNHVGGEFTGFWEPHMLYVKDGKLAMYYAADCLGGTAVGYPFINDIEKQQHIVLHLYDEETKQFGEPIIASNGIDHGSRDGMPSVCELADGTFAMVIESSSYRPRNAFIIQMLFSEDGIKWSEPKNIWIPKSEGHYAGAPFVAKLDDGRIAVSFQATEGSGNTLAHNKVNNSVMNVIISNKPISYADRDTISQADFDRVSENPIQTYEEHSYAIWPAMHVHKGKLYCSADLGVCTSPTGRALKGIHLRIGTIK